MRKLSAVVVGILLILGLVPSAAAAGTEPPKEPTASPSAPKAEKPKPADPKPSHPKTEDSDPEDGDGKEWVEEEDFEGDTELGKLKLRPTSGPAGSKVTVTSVTPCKGEDAQVEIMLASLSDFEDLDEDFTPKDYEAVDADESGAWKATVRVPSSAKTGEELVVIAACFGPGEIDEDSEPCLVYEPELFLVSEAPEAPVAKPVPGTPTYTG